MFNCNGDLVAIEDRCSHDDGNLLEGEIDPEDCRGVSAARLRVRPAHRGKPLNLPAYVPIDTFPVSVEDGVIRLEVD